MSHARTIRTMAITPLYTASEIDAEIAQAKLDLAAARKAISYQIGNSVTQRQAQRDRVESLQKHLEWLQQQRASLETGHGPQYVAGRPAR